MDGHTTCERAGGTPRVGRCIGRYLTCPRHRTPVAPLACPPGAELSPLCRGPKCLVAWHLDATPGPELVGLSKHPFGADVRHRELYRAAPRRAARAVSRCPGGSLGSAAAPRRDPTPRHAPGRGVSLAGADGGRHA